MRKTIALAALVAAATTGWPGVASADRARVAAVVNGDVITTDDVTEAIAMGGEQPQAGAPADEALRTRWLRLLIQSRLLSQEADRQRITVSDAEVAGEIVVQMARAGATSERELTELLTARGVKLESFKTFTRTHLKEAKLLRLKIARGISIGDAEVQAALEANRPNLEIGLSYRVRRMVIAPAADTEAAWEASRLRAEAVHADLASGRDVAGADLGVLRRGESPADLEAEIGRLAPGETSRPYRAKDGYHIVRLEEREALSPEALRFLRPHLREVIHRRTVDERCAALVRELRQRAVIQMPGDEAIPPPGVAPRPTTLGAYREAMRDRIAPFYVYPCVKNSTTSVCEYKAAQVLVTARLHVDGRLAGVTVERSSGIPIYDHHATNAVKLASPFDPIPDDLRVTGAPASISLRFDYIVDTRALLVR